MGPSVVLSIISVRTPAQLWTLPGCRYVATPPGTGTRGNAKSTLRSNHNTCPLKLCPRSCNLSLDTLKNSGSSPAFIMAAIAVWIWRVKLPILTCSTRSTGVSTNRRTVDGVASVMPSLPTNVTASLSNPRRMGIKFFQVRFGGAIASTWRTSSPGKTLAIYLSNLSA